MYLAEGLLNSSDVSIEDTSKILADIFMHPLRDCCWRVKASTLLASRKIAEKRDKNDIILTEDCGSDRSDLWHEGLGNFFLDDMFSYDTLILVPPKPIAFHLDLGWGEQFVTSIAELIERADVLSVIRRYHDRVG